MHAHYFQHVPFEGLGFMDPWLQKHGYSLSCTAFFDPNPQLPPLEEWDLLIVLGGPMGVNDQQTYPWLTAEIAYLQRAIAQGKTVLGICLGAQLMAKALGAEVYGNPEKEIGWFPIQGVGESTADTFQFPPSLEVFHWHGDTFTLPQGVQRLASSAACVNQAWQMGRRVMGLQCHLETTPVSAQALVDHCGHELVPGSYIQSAEKILAAPSSTFAAMHQTMAELLTYLTEGSNGE